MTTVLHVQTAQEPTFVKTLDADYYLTHFWSVIDSVATRYHALLSFDEHRYLKTIRSLSPDALCLYVRLINRKGPYFRVAKLNYLAPVSLHNAIQELTNQNLLHLVGDLTECETLLTLFTVPELRTHVTDKGAKRLGKVDLCAWLQTQETWPDFAKTLLTDHAVITLCATPWEFLKFLYFGQLTDNLSDFVIQELGHIQTETIDTAHLAPLFTARHEADDCYRMHKLYQTFRTMREDADCDGLLAWWNAQTIRRDALCAAAHEVFNKLIGRLGRIVERSDPQAAIAIYKSSPFAPSRERLIKLLLKHGEHDEAVQLCAVGLEKPADAEEHYALQQIWNRLHMKQRATQATQILKDYPSITLDWADSTVEQAVLDHFVSQGWSGVHSENWLWCNLFGLLLWDIVFDTQHGDFHNPLQIAPRHLFKPGFCTTRMPAIEQRLTILHDTDMLLQHVTDCHTQKHGLTNPFVSWHDDVLPMMETMLRHVPGHALQGVLQHMCRDLGVGCHGFPDLFLWQDDGVKKHYQFIEVKSATDRILPQQFNWLQIFQEHGLNISVLRVYKPAH